MTTPPLTRLSRALIITALVLSAATHAYILVVRPLAIGVVSRDSEEYWLIATNLATGNGYSRDGLAPTRMRMPGYPLFLAGVQMIAGPSVMAALIAQSLLDLLTLGLMVWAALRVAGPLTAGVTALLIGVYLPLPVLGCRIMSEALYIAILSGTIVCWLAALETRRASWFAATGLLIGLATLCRPAGLVLLPLLVPIVWLQLGRSRRGLAFGALALLVGLTVMSPWVLRNWLTFGRPILASTDSQTSLWFGTHPYMRTHWPEYATPFFALEEFRSIVGNDYYLQADASARLAEAARERVRSDPVGFVKLGLWKVAVTWTYLPGTRPLSDRSPVLFRLARIPQMVMLLLALLGAVRSPVRVWSIALTLAVVITGGVFVGPATARYIIPVVPLALLLCAVALTDPYRLPAPAAAGVPAAAGIDA